MRSERTGERDHAHDGPAVRCGWQSALHDLSLVQCVGRDDLHGDTRLQARLIAWTGL